MTAIAIFGLATITFGQTVPSYIPTSGLVGWWPFNGNANDESGNGNNGTVNGATLTTDRFGNANSAYSFDGVNDYISVLSSTSLNFGTGNSFTISFFYSPGSVVSQTSGFNGVIGKSWPTGINPPRGWQIGRDNSTLRFESRGGTDLTNPNNNPLCGDNNIYAITALQNDHYVFVFERVLNEIYLYKNSTLVHTTICSDIFREMDNNSPLLIGVDREGWFFSSGIMDDIGIWNRVLTQQEITDLYNGCQLSVNTQPTNQTININNNAQFVVGSSDPSVTYQWQTDLGVDFQNLNNVGQYSGTTNDTLTVSNVTMSNNNQPFRCIVSSGSCTDTSNVSVLTVNNNVGIDETNQGNLFSVFPNPAQSIINVKADSKLIGEVYTIYDNTGRVVLSGKLNAESTTIELGNLSGGIYMFSVGENMKQSFKVIKE